MPDSIRTLAATILTNPEEVEVTPNSTTAETVQQEVYFVDAENKKELLIEEASKYLSEALKWIKIQN